jgi:RNA polymerase sigma-70 factor, ECF subfamily
VQLFHRDRDVLGVIAKGSEAAFMALVDRHQTALLRLAEYWLEDDAVAEAVVEQTWLSVLSQLEGFDARAPLRVWLFAMLVRHLRARMLAPEPNAPRELKPAVDPERFSPSGDRWEGHWRRPPIAWPGRVRPELSVAERNALDKAIRALPRLQRAVLVLHDLEGLSSAHSAAIVELAEAEHDQLLHAARSQLRAAVDKYYEQRAGAR